MSASIVGECLRYSRARPTAKLVLVAIAEHANTDRMAWPSNSTLEALTGLGRSALYDALAQLEKAGEITRAESGKGRGRSTTWHVEDVHALYGEPVTAGPKRKAPPKGARPLVGTVKNTSGQPDVSANAETSGYPDQNVRPAGRETSAAHARASRNPQPNPHEQNPPNPPASRGG